VVTFLLEKVRVSFAFTFTVGKRKKEKKIGKSFGVDINYCKW